jgi:hypothetical protein
VGVKGGANVRASSAGEATFSGYLVLFAQAEIPLYGVPIVGTIFGRFLNLVGEANGGVSFSGFATKCPPKNVQPIWINNGIYYFMGGNYNFGAKFGIRLGIKVGVGKAYVEGGGFVNGRGSWTANNDQVHYKAGVYANFTVDFNTYWPSWGWSERAEIRRGGEFDW